MSEPSAIANARHVIEQWRVEMPHLVQPEPWLGGMVAMLDAYDLATQRAEAAEARRREIDDEAFDYAEQIEVLRAERDALRKVAEAATDMLKLGAHDGPCDNADDEDEACTLHVKASRSRTVTLRAALDAALAVPPTTEGL